MKRRFSFDPVKFTHLADNAQQMAHELGRTAAAVKAIDVAVREIYYHVSPLLERLKSK